MNSKPHRNNTDFQLVHFLLGDCKTPDGAWTLLYGQKIDMESKIATADAQRLRREAKIIEAEEIIADENSSKSKKMNAEADIIEANANVTTWNLNLEAAKMELSTIKNLMEKLEPLRKYKHLPLLEANEACQQEEWLLELKSRAENFLLCNGTIPPDEFRTMRCHPQFEKVLVPHINKMHVQLGKSDSLADRLLLSSKSEMVELLKIGHD
jgi:hypothetical protein